MKSSGTVIATRVIKFYLGTEHYACTVMLIVYGVY